MILGMIDVTSHDGNNLWEVDVVVIGIHKQILTLSFQCKSVLTIRWEWSMEDSQKFYSISMVLKLICTCIFSLGKWSLSTVKVFFVQVLLLVLFPHAAWSWKYKPKRIVVFKYFNKHLSKSCCGRGLAPSYVETNDVSGRSRRKLLHWLLFIFGYVIT